MLEISKMKANIIFKIKKIMMCTIIKSDYRTYSQQSAKRIKASERSIFWGLKTPKNKANTIKVIAQKVESLNKGHAVNCMGVVVIIAQNPTTKRTLNTADPTIVPNPTSLLKKVPTKLANNSGADPPAAINVAPATSSDNPKLFANTSKAGQKKSSAIIANPMNKYSTPKK